MIHPLLHLVATKPQLLGDHVEAYAALLGAEVGKTSKMFVSRAVLYGAAGAMLLAGLLFTGIALMLWAVVPGDSMNAPWLLIAVPLVPLLGGAACFFAARSKPGEKAFDTVKQQFSADLAMLREVSAAS